MASVSLGTGNLSYGGAVLQTSGGARYAVYLASTDSLVVARSIDTTPANATQTSTQVTGTASALVGIDAAIDGSDNIHIVAQGYASTHTRDVSYCVYNTGTNTFGTWEQAAPLLNTPVVRTCAIALDSADAPHIVYTDEEAGASYTVVKYTNKVSGSWISAETVSVTTTNNYRYPRILVRNSDIVEVLYYNNNTADAVYRTRTSGSWGSETLIFDGTAPNVFGQTSTTAGTVYRYTASINDIRENGTDTTLANLSSPFSVAPALVDTTRILLYGDASNIKVSTTTDGTWSAPATVVASTHAYIFSDYRYQHWNAGPTRLNFIFGSTSAVYYDFYTIPAGGGTDALTATGIATGAPTVGTPTLTQNAGTDALTATGIATGAPTVATPALGQKHTLSAASIATGAPTCGTTALGQKHALNATGISTTPTVDAPALGHKYALNAVGVTAAPVVGKPAIGQKHGLAATGIATGAPTVGAPALVRIVALTASGVTSTPTVGTPAIGQKHALGATGFVTGAPTVGTPSMSGEIALTAIGVTATPVVGTPTLAQKHVLSATGVTASPTVGAPSIGQKHVLAATGIATGTPTVGTPSMVGSVALTAQGIATGAPTVGTPALKQAHALNATGVTATPVVGAPTIAQVHFLTALILTLGAPTVGNPALFSVGTVQTPDMRRVRVEAELRRWEVAQDERAYRVPVENRIFTVED